MNEKLHILIVDDDRRDGQDLGGHLKGQRLGG